MIVDTILILKENQQQWVKLGNGLVVRLEKF